MSFSSKTVKGMITSWSFSRWGTYEECPAKARYKFIDKLPEPSAPALERGTKLHEMCEQYLRTGGKIPKDVALISYTLKDFKKRGAIPEAEFAFDQNWKPVSWFDRSAWCRIKADATLLPIVDADAPIAEVHDFKTGGQRKLESGDFGEYFTQLELYSLAGLLTYPIAQQVKSSLVFIDFNKIVENPEVAKRGDEKKLMKKWEIRVKKMLTDTQFKPKPGNACRWCHFRKSNNGPCCY